jgi:hypothetical protein
MSDQLREAWLRSLTQSAQISIRNVFGNAETIAGQTSAGIGTVSSSARKNQNAQMASGTHHQLTFARPLFADPDTKLEVNAYSMTSNHTLLNSFCETMQGGNVKYTTMVGRRGKYTAGYDLIWRENHSLAADASLSYTLLIQVLFAN